MLPSSAPSRSTQITVLAVMIALASTSCFGLQRRGTAQPSPTKTSAYGGALDLDDDVLKIDEPAPSGAARGRLEVQLLDTENTPIAGAVLRYRGPSKGTAATDRRGVATFRLPAGDYTIDVLKCGRTVVVDDTAEANARVVPDQTKRGRLQVDAGTITPRYQPTNTAVVEERAPWRLRESITIGVAFEDTCRFERAPGVGIGTYRWRASGGLDVVAAERKTDRRGIANVQVVCARAGDATLEIYDATEPDRVVDVLAALPNPAFGAWCG